MADGNWVEQHSPEIFHCVFDNPSGPVGIDTLLIEDRKNKALAWQSVAGAEIDIEARFSFATPLRAVPPGPRHISHIDQQDALSYMARQT